MAPSSSSAAFSSSLSRLSGSAYMRRAPAASSSSSSSFLTSTLSSLAKRQTIVAIPTTYGPAGPPPGEVAGIVLGSVAGFLLVLWLIYTCFNLGGRSTGEVVVDTTNDVEIRQRRSSRAEARVHSRSRSEYVDTRHSPRRERSRRRETVVIEESRRGPPPPVSDVEDDIVEVIEEHSPPPPQARRERRERRVSSGYRAVDPEAFAGGGRPIRKVSGRR